MNEHIVKIDTNNLHEIYEFDKVAKQANGAVMYRQGKAVLIAAVAVDDKAVDEDFLPLTVQYMERAYAATKIPGGFVKRETKPGDFEILTARIIDRSLRPLFPEGFGYPVVISIMVVSSDSDVDMQVAALHAANAALYVSDLPFTQSVSAVRIGKIGGELVLNPTLSEQEESTLDLYVAGSGRDVLMIEMRSIASEVVDDVEPGIVDPMMPTLPVVLDHQECNELSAAEMIEAIALAVESIEQATLTYGAEFDPYKKEPVELALKEDPHDSALYGYIKENFHQEVVNAVRSMAKSERSTQLSLLRGRIAEAYGEVDGEALKKTLEAYKKSVVRTMILDEQVRADGRGLEDVRPISIETSFLPSVHGSCLFTRGETQALVTVTLGDSKDAQSYELITSKQSQYERFMVHYNFLGFSVGEAKFAGAPGRRELGHGNLARRALEPALDMDYDGTIRIVSEILESNGSSSMATVCGGALALRSANIGMVKLVAGVAMGLVSEGGRAAVLTDIMGLEDHDGDMDFKITGTYDGITALQMDIKLGGIELDLLSKALEQAGRAKKHILDIMYEAQENIMPSPALPSTEVFSINPAKIADIIGKSGATIREIIEKFDVTIDIDRDKGGVKVVGHNDEKVKAAKEHIQGIASTPIKTQMVYELGKVYEGRVKKIVDFGVFVEMPDGFDALLHISKVSKERIASLESLYSEGDMISVVVMEQKGKKVGLATPEFLGL